MPIDSKTDIANLALAEIGARRINSIESDQSVESKACKLHLDHVVNMLLRQHQWSFATKRKSLSRLSVNPPTEWAGQWQLPGDFVRLIRVVGSSGDPAQPVRDFSIEGRAILLAGAERVDIVYVSNDVPVPYWDPLFIDAVVYQLAAKIAGDVSKNPALAENCLAKFKQLALPTAQTADAAESLSGENFGPRHLAAGSALVNARFRADGRPPYVPTIPRTPTLPE